ncbi:diguanylate cyclase [Komagataeibacter nataicola]|uniref:Diguanylate cyclase n=1 Tax=Komagataeibacter nataicola TaxID=265960 RepID=A0A9N7CM16_9PROT|nr:dipeptidase [Komagataeibacter nataicola]AQU87938.1 diguanylate cyclase [Komagataeibacter nataicola]PYD66468.1 diguanylate cyclase [Komagataeibacter nataicola]WEQ55657.1 dipeptidase [Komagataeibacter nataicola]GBR26603.1 dipeptidase [Komagataeibacter nataicola NRIC 0616]
MTDTSADLHHTILTLDTHVDIPWPDRGDFATGAPSRRVDLPRMRAGGLRAACLVAYVGQGACDADGHAAASARALAMLRVINDAGRTEGVRVCDTAAGVRAAYAAGDIAIVPAVENGYAMGDNLSLIGQFRALGARYMTLTHNGHNSLADSARPMHHLNDPETLHGGLSALGRAAIAEMNRTGMLIDVSHTARDTMMQAVELSRAPVFASHSCVRALCDHPRNLDDGQLDALRACGGVIHITAMDAFLRPRDVRDLRPVTVADFVDHIDYAVQRIGIKHVGISSDFDGGGGIRGWADASESGNLTAELQRRGYDHAQIAALWGENFLRLLDQADAVARTGA